MPVELAHFFAPQTGVPVNPLLQTAQGTADVEVVPGTQPLLTQAANVHTDGARQP